jgi:hypothetical protein
MLSGLANFQSQAHNNFDAKIKNIRHHKRPSRNKSQSLSSSDTSHVFNIQLVTQSGDLKWNTLPSVSLSPKKDIPHWIQITVLRAKGHKRPETSENVGYSPKCISGYLSRV